MASLHFLSNIICVVSVEEVQNSLHEEQVSFKSNISCANLVCMLGHIIEQCKEWQKSMILNFFFHLKKAFNCEHRASMWNILEFSDIQVKIINIMRNMHFRGKNFAAIVF